MAADFETPRDLPEERGLARRDDGPIAISGDDVLDPPSYEVLGEDVYPDGWTPAALPEPNGASVDDLLGRRRTNGHANGAAAPGGRSWWSTPTPQAGRGGNGQPPTGGTTAEAPEATVTVTVDDETPREAPFTPPVDGYIGDFRAAPDLERIVDRLITRQPVRFGSLATLTLRCYWWAKSGKKGCETFGKIGRPTGWTAHLLPGVDMLLALSAERVVEAGYTERHVEAALFHLLSHIGFDENLRLVKYDHDFEGFQSEFQQYGAWNQRLRHAERTFTQASLFGDEDED